MQSVSVCLYFLAWMDVMQAYLMWNGGYMNAENPNKAVEYIYHTVELSWSEARLVCQENGGDLATIETSAQLERILYYAEKSGINDTVFLNKDYWVGLYAADAGSLFWVFDCTPLQDNTEFDLATGGNRHCFYRHAGSINSGASEKCSLKKPFLCQRNSNTFCEMDEVFFASVINGPAMTSYDSCMDMCISNISCTNSIFLPKNSTCYHLQTTLFVNSEIQMTSKFCIKVSVNNTRVNGSKGISHDLPDSYCGATASYINFNSYSRSLTVPVTTSAMDTTSYLQPSYCIPVTTTVTTSTVMTVPYDTNIPPTINSMQTSCIKTVGGAISPVLVTSSTVNASHITAQLQEINNIVRNLTVNAKTTSAYTRKLSSAYDSRTTSAVMGYVCLICVLVPVAVIFVSDMKLIYFQIRANGFSSTRNGTSFKLRRIQLN